MTEQELTAAIALAVPKDQASADVVARSVLGLAISRVGRINNVSFNREWLSFAFVAGTSRYKLGKDVLQKYPTIWNVQEMYLNDQANSRIEIMNLDQFNRRARGSTSMGRPYIGTIHSSTATLEVFPIPDSNYTAECYAKVSITQLSQIPVPYHDILYAVAILLITASKDPVIAAKIAREGLDELLSDALVGWNGSVIEAERTVQGSSIAAKSRSNADSHNLTGVG